MSDVKEFAFPPDFQETMDKIHRHGKIYNIYIYTLFSIYVILQIILENPCEKFKEKENLSHYCGLFVPSILPFDIHFFPVYQLFFLIEVITSVHMFFGCCYIMFLAYEIVVHIENRLNHLCLISESIPNEEDDKLQKERMRYCIRYHQHIIW